MKPFPAVVLSVGLVLATINVQAGAVSTAPQDPAPLTRVAPKNH